MSDRLGDVAASALLLAVAGAACVGAWRLGLGDVHNPGPGFMPLAAAALLALMALVQLGRQVASPAGGAGARPFARSRWAVIGTVLGTIAGFGALIGALGFAISTFLMLVVLFGVIAGKRWWVTLAAALAIAVVASLGFRALGLQLPAGPLGF